MSYWSVAEAKAQLSELLMRARDAPQHIRRRGREAAVVLSTEQYERLAAAAAEPAPSPMQAFLAATEQLKGDGDLTLHLPHRRRTRGRPPPFDHNP